MTNLELKKQMARLWKATFHDTDAYISLVFDHYFDPDLCEYEEMDGEIIASLMGIPYNFGNSESTLKGLYLCGLATNPKYRSRGIMTKLLDRINEKAKESGFCFTFLIPADQGLRGYYSDRGYVNAFYRVVDNYTSLHDFTNDYESFLTGQKEQVSSLKRHYFDSLQSGVLQAGNLALDERILGVKALIRIIEDNQEGLQILHGDDDIDLLIEEHRLSGGDVHYACTNTGVVTAVAFCQARDKAIDVVKIFASDMASKYKVLDSIKRAYPDYGIRHYMPSIEMDRKALWLRTYGTVMKDAEQVPEISMTERVYSLAAHSQVYGMVRILDLAEILRFQAKERSDLKYSILVKSSDIYTLEQIDVRKGELNIKKLTSDDIDSNRAAYIMSRRDIGEILFRRRDTDNLITEAFGIPSINGAISMLLD